MTQALQIKLNGSTFESLVEASSRNFAALDATPLDARADFRWRISASIDPRLALISHEYEAEWESRPTAETHEWLLIMLPRAGALDLAFGRQVVQGAPGSLILANNQEIEYCRVRGGLHRSDVLHLDWKVISRAAAAVLDVPLVGRLELQPTVGLSTPEGQLIGNLAQTLVAGMRDEGPLLNSPLAIAHLMDALAELVVRYVPHRLSHLLEKQQYLIAPWHVRRAIDFMHANIGEPLTISTVAEAVGVSVRTLESAFRVFKETTPATYLRTIRLKAAREDLCDPSSPLSVKDICLKWGFFHFGRFSAVYRTAYGESPSGTRKRTSTA